MSCLKSTKDILHLIDTRKTVIRKWMTSFWNSKGAIIVPNRRKWSYPQAVLAFKSPDAAQAEHKDRQLVLTGVDYSKKTELSDQKKSSLRNLFLVNKDITVEMVFGQ